jgi:hypothetical protein
MVHRIRLGRRETYRTAALCSEVWQKRKRTSRRDFVKAYLADIVERFFCRSVGLRWYYSGVEREVPAGESC